MLYAMYGLGQQMIQSYFVIVLGSPCTIPRLAAGSARDARSDRLIKRSDFRRIDRGMVFQIQTLSKTPSSEGVVDREQLVLMKRPSAAEPSQRPDLSQAQAHFRKIENSTMAPARMNPNSPIRFVLYIVPRIELVPRQLFSSCSESSI